MDGVTKGFAIALTGVSTAVIFVIAFAWFGPGISGVTPFASAALFDEERVQAIYRDAIPAVVAVNVDRKVGDAYERISLGSGFLVDTEGHIVTNNHVIEGADRIRVEFQDGTDAEVQVLGTNPANDLALLQIDPSLVAGIQPLILGDSSLVKPGLLAVAIGNPFGLEGSVTVGVISGVNRTLDSDIGRTISGVLQTDALIRPGNSGGPLLDSDGMVLGINTAIQVSDSSFSFLEENKSSIGFAVPSNTLADLLPRLVAGELISPPFLGVSLHEVDTLLAERFDLPDDRGVYVTQVMPDGPADTAGVVGSGALSPDQATLGGDVIVGIDGVAVNSVAELVSEVNGHLPGDQVTLEVASCTGT